MLRGYFTINGSSSICDTDYLLRTVNFFIVLVPGLKRNLFSSLAAAKKGVQTTIERNGLSLDLVAFSVQLTRLGSMNPLDLTTLLTKVEEHNLLFT